MFNFVLNEGRNLNCSDFKFSIENNFNIHVILRIHPINEFKIYFHYNYYDLGNEKL